MHFEPERFPVEIRDDLLAALRASWAEIGAPGTWWSGEERVAIAHVARNERLQRDLAPWQRARKAGNDDLPSAALGAARRIAADAHNLDRDWAEQTIGELGDTRYVELASIVVTVCAADAFCEAIGVEPEPLPESASGQPARERPEGVGDIGAWVPAIVDYGGPNVGRALSLVPAGVKTFFRMVSTMYASDDFNRMVWDHRPMPRPQVELLAAKVSAANECFY